jgi:hypothetical protein
MIRLDFIFLPAGAGFEGNDNYIIIAMLNGILFQSFHWYYPANGSLWQWLAK